MMKKNKLSHSQVSRYGLCPKSYEFHYVRKIRTSVMSAALVYGSALDSALNQLLLPEENKGSPESVFESEFLKHY